MQKISISPEVWAQTRRRAFDEGVTASSLVEAALTAFLAEPVGAQPRARAAGAVPLRHNGRAVGEVTSSRVEEGVLEFTARVDDPAVAKAIRAPAPWDDPRDPVDHASIDTSTQDVTNYREDGSVHSVVTYAQRTVPESKPEFIDLGPTPSPADVERRVAALSSRPFTPAPKPVAKPKAARARR